MEVIHVLSFWLVATRIWPNFIKKWQEILLPVSALAAISAIYPPMIFPKVSPYLGQPKEVVTYLQQHHIEQVYCCLPSARSHEIVPIINYCENHLIRFYSVPNIRNYLHRRMHFEMFGNIPVLTIREEPLTQMENRLLKRAFDLFFSPLFPLYRISLCLYHHRYNHQAIFFRPHLLQTKTKRRKTEKNSGVTNFAQCVST